MATDRPGDYVGNHGGAYTDMDGQSKQFTYIDHDPKIKIATGNKEDISVIKQALKDARARMIEEILSIPAVMASHWHQDYTIRGADTPVVSWNETMLRDEGLDFNLLRDILTLAGNKQRLLKQGITL